MGPGTIIAETQETASILHKSMVPPSIQDGTVIKAAPDGEYNILEPVSYTHLFLFIDCPHADLQSAFFIFTEKINHQYMIKSRVKRLNS